MVKINSDNMIDGTWEVVFYDPSPFVPYMGVILLAKYKGSKVFMGEIVIELSNPVFTCQYCLN